MNYQKIKKYIYFLDLELLKKICNKLNIFYNIFIEKNDKIIKTNLILHKDIIIKLILKKIKYDKTSKIIYYKNIQNYDKINKLTENSFIYFGKYKTTDKNILNLLLKLTDNKFKFGAISEKLVKDSWKRNKLITYKDLANLWLKNNEKGINYKELAYNNFMKKFGDKTKWFEKKNKIINYFTSINLL